MAEKNESWLGSWYNAAKNKSTEVMEFVRKDLEEFGNAVKNEATSVVSTTGTVIEKTLRLNEPESTASNMKRSISSFLGQMNDALNPSPDDSDTEAIMIVDGEVVTLTKLQKTLYELQKNDATFLTDPDSSLRKQYECWLEIIEDQLTDERITKHLSSSKILNDQYLKLVPENVSHIMFWKRYLFRKALIEDELAREEAMERREQKEREMTEDDLKWEQEDFANDLELTEEEQIRLLEEYERETKLKLEQKPKLMESDLDTTLISSDESATKIPQTERSTGPHDLSPSFNARKVVPKTINENSAQNSPSCNSSNTSTDDDWEKINDDK